MHPGEAAAATAAAVAAAVEATAVAAMEAVRPAAEATLGGACARSGTGEAERATLAEGGVRVPDAPGVPVRTLRAREGSCGAIARTSDLDLVETPVATSKSTNRKLTPVCGARAHAPTPPTVAFDHSLELRRELPCLPILRARTTAGRLSWS